MNLHHAATQTNANPDLHRDRDTRLYGHWLILARIMWSVLVALSLALFIAAIPLHATHLHLVCARVTCEGTQTTAELAQQLHALGLSVDFYATYSLTLELVFALVYFIVAVILAWRKFNDWMALLAALFLVTFVVIYIDAPRMLMEDYPSWSLPVACLAFIGELAFPLFFYQFPDGRFVPRWTRWLLIGWFAWAVPTSFFPDLPYRSGAWFLPLESVLFVLGIGSMLLVQLYRYRYVSGPVQRQQTKWVVFGMTVGLGGFLAAGLFGFILPGILSPLFSWSDTASSAFVGIVVITVSYLAMLFVPLTLVMAILRFRLWEIDLIVNKTLVYGALTAALVVVYLGIIVLIQQVFHTFASQEPELVIVGSTLAIAALFQPLRRRIQTDIDRRFYRRRYDAERTLAAFSASLREEVDLEQLSERLTAVVEETMQPAYVSLWLPGPVKSNVTKVLPRIEDQEEAKPDKW